MTPARLAGIVTVVGSGSAIAGSFLPWIEATDPSTGITLTKAGIEGHYAMVVDLMALIAAAITGLVSFRRAPTVAAAVAIVVLAIGQLGLVVFVGSNLSRGVVQLKEAGAVASLGYGFYLTALGALTTLIGGILAWAWESSRIET
jgi:hypothetical protein